MTYTLPHLVWLRSFEAAARHHSFALAARELNLTPAAVSQQIRALERHLGYALFDRLARGIRATELGSAYVPAVRKALDELSVATTGLFGAGSTRRLTIRSPVSFAALRISPILGDFRASHPDIAIRVFSSVWSDAIHDDLVDIDIRYGDGRWDGYDIQRLGSPVSVPVCPPGPGLGRNVSSKLAQMVGANPIHIISCENLWTKMAQQLGWPEGTIGTGLAVDTSVIALEMVSAGLGCAMISKDLASSHIETGRVQIPAGLELHHDQAHYLLMARRARASPPEALLFRDWLIRNSPECLLEHHSPRGNRARSSSTLRSM